MPVWQAWRYVRAYDQLKTCEDTNSKLQIALDKSTDALQKGEAVIIQLNEQLGHQQVISENWKQAFEVEQKTTTEKIKKLRKDKFRLVLVSIGQAVIIVLLII